MKHALTYRSPRPWRALLAFVMLMALTGPIIQPVGAQGGNEAPLDLAAMVLTPEDTGIDELGFGIFRNLYLLSIDEQAANVAQIREMDEAEIAGALEDAGFLRGYYSQMAVPSDSEASVSVGVSSSVEEYADADGAAAVFQLLEEDAEEGLEAEDVDEAPAFGDQSEVTRSEGFSQDVGKAYVALQLSFRLDNLNAYVTMTAFDAEEPELDEVVALGEALQERIEAVLDGEAPGLSTLVLRLEGDELNTEFDRYTVISGEILPRYREPAEKQEQRAERVMAMAVVDHHELQQALQPGAEAQPDDPLYTVQIRRFEDEDAASAWLMDTEARLLGGDYLDVRAEELPGDLGDESAAFSYTFEVDTNVTVDGHIVVVRVGEIAASIQVDAGMGVELDVVMDLARKQLECLEEGACLDPIPVPEEILTLRGDGGLEEEETPDADEDETAATEDDQAAGGIDGTTYTSPTYGFTLEWDGDTWVVSQEDDDPTDRVDTLLLQNFNTGVFVYFRTEDGYEGDPDACVAATDEEITNRAGIENVERNDELGLLETPDGVPAAAAVYTYMQDGEEYAEAVYCLVLGGGETMLGIYTRGLLRFYDAHLTSNQELLDGLELEAEDTETPEADEDATETPEAVDQEAEAEETPEADETVSEGGIDGTTYTSPTYGYTLEWDEDQWTADTETAVVEGRDTLILDAAEGTGFVYVEGYDAYVGDPEACLEGSAEELLSTEGYADVEPLELDGDLAEAPDAGAVAAYTLSFETSDGEEVPGVAYFSCQTLVEDEAVLAVSYLTFEAEYEAGIEAVQDVMASLELAG